MASTVARYNAGWFERAVVKDEGWPTGLFAFLFISSVAGIIVFPLVIDWLGLSWWFLSSLPALWSIFIAYLCVINKVEQRGVSGRSVDATYLYHQIIPAYKQTAARMVDVICSLEGKQGSEKHIEERMVLLRGLVTKSQEIQKKNLLTDDQDINEAKALLELPS